jgi:hypothetical protein
MGQAVSQVERGLTPMALQPCRECGRDVSTEAISCPHCGAPRPAEAEWTGTGYEWASRTRIFGIPLVHVAVGRTKTGKPRVAKGFVAIGQYAVGLVTIAQFGVGILFGLGQFMVGLVVVAQFAAALAFAVGQFAVGVVTIGQVVAGIYGLCQTGWAKYMWSPSRVDMEAVALFHTIYMRLLQLLEYVRHL